MMERNQWVHSLTCLSLPPEATRRPLTSQSRAQIWSACPGRSIISFLVLMSQSLRVESWLAEIMYWLSTDQLITQTEATCPEKLHMNSPVQPSHSLIFLSKLPLAMYRPSGENRTCTTGLPCPTICFTGTLLGSSNSIRVKSSEQVTNRSFLCSVAFWQRARAPACLSLPWKPFPGSQQPLLMTCSVERDMLFTQWLCLLTSRSTFPLASKQQMRRSSEQLMISLLPDHRTLVTHLVWLPNDRRQVPLRVFQSRRVESLEAETRRSQALLRWRGIQAREVTNLVWPLRVTCSWVSGEQTVMLPFFSAKARCSASGAHWTIITQLSALISLRGVCVKTSQRRRVPSPDPDARWLQSGLNCSESTASVWPYMLLEERVTGRTLKLLTGWQMTSRLASKLVQEVCWKKTDSLFFISLVWWKKLNSSCWSLGSRVASSCWNSQGPAVRGSSQTPREASRLLMKLTRTFLGSSGVSSSLGLTRLRPLVFSISTMTSIIINPDYIPSYCNIIKAVLVQENHHQKKFLWHPHYQKAESMQSEVIIQWNHILHYNCMKIAQRTSGLLKETHYPEALSRRCVHGLLLLSWLLMVLVGTTLLGVSTSNHSAQFPFCLDTESFCSQNVLFNTSGFYHFYIKLSSFHQNNRMFMDSLSIKQQHGQVSTPDHCGNYYTYGSLGLSQTVGGYRVNSSADLHPCGEVMSHLKADSLYVVDSEGGTPQLDSSGSSLVSGFNRDYHFLRLEQYQLSQWADVQSQQMVNYLGVAATGTKYLYVGAVEATAANYQVVMQNNLATQGQFKKELLVTQVGVLGVSNHLVGFCLFSYGLLLLFLHIYICYRWKK